MTTTLLADKIVSATELNRRPSEILALALDSPVTVTYKGGDCVILGRDSAAKLFQEEKHLTYLMGLANYMLARFCQASWNALGQEFRWLDGFDKEDVLEFFREYCETLRSRTSRAADLENVLHEWQESAAALRNGDLLAVVESASKR